MQDDLLHKEMDDICNSSNDLAFRSRGASLGNTSKLKSIGKLHQHALKEEHGKVWGD